MSRPLFVGSYLQVTVIIPNLFLRAGFFGEHVQSVFIFDYQAISVDRKLAEVLDLRTFKLNLARVRVVLTNRKFCTLAQEGSIPRLYLHIMARDKWY